MKTAPSYQPRPYQIQAIADLRASVASGHRAPVLVLPTGGGKTICAAHLILGAVNKGRKVLFLSPRREIVFQTSEKLTALAVPHGIIMAGERPSMTPDVQVVSVPTLFARYFRDHDDGAFARELPAADLIVIDELHACMSRMTTRILSAYPKAVRIGLTATPARSDGRGLGEICDDMVFGPSVAELTEMGMLVPLRYFGAEKADLSAVRMQAGDYHQTDLGEAMNKPKLVGDVVQNWLRLCPDRLTVVFAVNRAHAKALQDEFISAGVSAGYIDGETPNDERHEIFDAMVAGDMRVLCSVDVVSMGWDLPLVSCGIIARPTKSVARYLQMCLDEKTEILTKRGWVGIDGIAGADEVAAFEQATSRVVFQRPTEIIHRTIESGEKMLQMRGPAVDVRVTDGHEMLWVTGHDLRNGRGFRKDTAARLRERKTAYAIPISGVADFAGVDLTDDELRFIGLVLSDGTINKTNKAITICQSAGQPNEHHEYIKRVLNGCGFRYGVSRTVRKDITAGYPDMIAYTVSFGMPSRVSERHMTGWAKLEPFIDKQLSPMLDDATPEQFEKLLEGINLGDGRKFRCISDYTPRTMSIAMGNDKAYADRLQAMCVVRGWKCNLSIHYYNKSPLYVAAVRKKALAFVAGSGKYHGDEGKPKLELSETRVAERVWCVTVDAGNIVTRRNGKVAILGNCGRIMRIHPSKQDSYLIDHAGAVDELGFADDPQPWSLDGKSKIQERKAAAKAEPKPIECSQCHRVFKPAKICPGCGHDMGGRAAKAIEAHQAELQEIDRKTREPKKATMADKQQWWSGFLHMARERGKSDRWVLAQYKSKFGVWPRGLVDTPLPPMPEMLSWEHSQRIRWAKGGRR